MIDSVYHGKKGKRNKCKLMKKYNTLNNTKVGNKKKRKGKKSARSKGPTKVDQGTTIENG